MKAEAREDVSTEFMLAEYQDLYQNIMHLENKLFSHLSFFTTVFMGIVTASVAILQLGKDASSSLARPEILLGLSLLFGLFVIVGRFELRMATELRIRKMKFVEGVTQIRQYFAEKDKSVVDYLVLPVGLHKAPPYLRVRSKDWYQVIYMSFMLGIAVFIAWTCLICALATWLIQVLGAPIGWILAALVAPAWLLVGALLFYLMFWEFSYRSVMDFCESYNKRREERMGRKSEYDLFECPLPESPLRWTFGDWIWLIEQRRKVK